MSEMSASVSEMKEFRLCVPPDLARRFKGVSLDAGSSVLKFVYKSTEDEEETHSGDSKYGHLHLVSFPLHELSSSLEYVRQRSVITRGSGDSERPTIYATGFGCIQHGKLIADTFSVRLQQLTEFDCFVKSFTYLAARLPRSEFLEPFLDEATVQPVENVKKQVAVMKKVQDLQLSEASGFDEDAIMAGIHHATGKPPETENVQENVVPLSEAEPDMYPCLLAMCGSGFGFYKVEKDGSFTIADSSNRGGRTFVGLGTQLTGYKTFSELIEAASKGDQRSVDQFTNDMKCTDSVAGEDNAYTMFIEDMQTEPVLAFCFGKAVGSEIGQFKREDLARSLLSCLILDLVQCVQLITRCHAIKRVFFTGSFCSTPLVRSIITTEFARRNLYMLTFGWGGPFVTLDFVKPGAHLGALGCVVYDAEKSTSS